CCGLPPYEATGEKAARFYALRGICPRGLGLRRNDAALCVGCRGGPFAGKPTKGPVRATHSPVTGPTPSGPGFRITGRHARPVLFFGQVGVDIGIVGPVIAFFGIEFWPVVLGAATTHSQCL